MSISFWKFLKGILLKGESSDPSDNVEGSIWHNSTDNKVRAYLNSSVRELTTNDQAQSLTNKTIDVDQNTFQNLSSNVDHDQTTNTHNLTTDIDHDQLTNFVAAEHIDWSVTGVEDVNDDRIAESSVTQHEGAIDHNNLTNTHNLTTDIDHDQLTNFVAAEHIDWSSTGVEDINDDRIAESSVTQHEGAIDHNNLTNTHNLTTDIDHDQITNTHNLTSDIDHTQISNVGSNSHSDIDTHIGSTTQHGVTGSIVGTSDSQTLTNKTFDDAITGKEIATPSNPASGYNKLYFKNDDKLYKLASDGTEKEVGSGGAGDADTIHLIESDNILISEVDLSGNNSDFDGGGSIVGSVAFSTTSTDLLKSLNQVIKYSADSSDGSDDYFGFTKNIPLAYRGRTLGFQFEYKTHSSVIDDDFRFCIKIKDGTNAGLITYENLPAFDSNNIGKTAKFVEFVPYDCTEVEIGIQSQTATTTATFIIDNILITANPFINKNLLDIQSYRIYQNGSSLTNRVGELEFNLGTATIQNEGAQLIKVEDDSANTRTKFTALTDIPQVTIIGQGAPDTTNYGMGLLINDVQICLGDVSANFGYSSEISWTGSLKAGDYFTLAVTNSSFNLTQPTQNSAERCSLFFTAQAEKEAVVHVGDLEIEEVFYDGYTSKDGSNRVKFKTEQINTSADLISVDNTTFTKVTFLSRVHFNFAASISNAGTIGATKLYINLYDSSNTLIKSISQFDSGASSKSAAMSGIASLGDYVVVTSSDGSADNTDATFHLTAVPTARTIITPLTQTAYLKDVKASGTNGGTGASGWNTRTLNTVSGDSSICSLSVNQFTLGKGTYELTSQSLFYSGGNNVGSVKTRLQNISDSITEEVSLNSRTLNSASATGNDTISIIEHKFTLTAPKTFELQYNMGTPGVSSDELGQAASAGVNEIYTIVKITKL